MPNNTYSTPKISVSLPPEVKKHFEDIIKSSGAEIIPAEKYNLPKKFKLPKIKAGGKPYVSKAIDIFINYLLCPIVADKFHTHEQRRDWREKTFEKISAEEGDERAFQFDEFLKMNKMKRNRISGVFMYADLLGQYTDIPKDLTFGLMSAIKETLPVAHGKVVTDPMEGPTTSQKMEKVKKISEAIVKVLDYLGEK